MNKFPGRDPDDNYHPTRCTRKRFSADDGLRKRGFAIHSRPRKGETTWTRAGTVYLETDALMTIAPLPPG